MPQRKISRLQRPRQEASNEQFFDMQIPFMLNEGDTEETAPKLRVIFNDHVMREANKIEKGLRASRGIVEPRDINDFHPLVQKVIKGTILYKQTIMKTANGELTEEDIAMTIPNYKVDEAVETVQQAMTEWALEAREDAIKVAMLRDNISIEQRQGGLAFRFTEELPPVIIPEDVWNDDLEAWQEHVAVYRSVPWWLPSRHNAAEIQAQLVLELLDNYPSLAIIINGLFERAVRLIATAFYYDEVEPSAADAIGFQFKRLGPNLDAGPESRAEAKTRRRSARVVNAEVPQGDGLDPQ
jgi:hypothetical protein